MGRLPTPEDLVVPMPRPTNRSPRVEFGGMRTDHHSYKRLLKDMEALGLRYRRGHDLRRTMISLARTDGARKDILELCTRTPCKSGNTIDLYTTSRGRPSAPRWPSSRCSAKSAASSVGCPRRPQGKKKPPARQMAPGVLLQPLLQSPGKLSPFRQMRSGGGGNRTRAGRCETSSRIAPLPRNRPECFGVDIPPRPVSFRPVPARSARSCDIRAT
ncbi:phage integrase-like protein [Stigmatella aurantiaca DW4/3-1]|uniref:Phage integrase-like protein n=1 Tax=Stigmatella aurantiaca (strain DW4/3-1) TaxID=378806 RepID=E3FYA2_STIAD|nr:phage integrase-like protein [Stigmatella aurantiaca DW4/3-1]